MKPIIRSILMVLVASVLFTAPLAAQTALSNTTLSAQITNPTDRVMTVGSTTGWTASSAQGQTYALVDREIVQVMSVNTTTGVIGILRTGQYNTRPTAHPSGAIVYFLPQGAAALSTFERAGRCLTTGSTDPTQDASTLPIIVPASNAYYQCINSVWYRQDITDTFLMKVTGLPQVAANTQVAGGNALTVTAGAGSAGSSGNNAGGVGGAPSVVGGAGGAGIGSSAGGAGGADTFTGGVGGLGGATGVGGAGGAIVPTGGVGGAGGATSGTGGAGGANSPKGGVGGAATAAAATGGAGGAFAPAGGVGGASGSSGTGGAGGAASVSGGAGGGTITGGAGGNASLIAGAGGNGSTAGGSGGAAIIQAGAAGTGGTGTAGKITMNDAADATKQVLWDLSSMTTAKALTLAASSANSRTYTLGDNGGNGSFNVFSSIPATVQAPPLTVYASAGYTNATTTFSNVTGLVFSVAANTSYHAVCYLTWNPGGATTVGPKYIWTGPASPTAVTAAGILAKTVTTASYLSVAAASFATTLDDAVAVTASITQTDVLSIGVVNGANAGTVQLQAALHSASGTYTLSQGSYCTVQ